MVYTPKAGEYVSWKEDTDTKYGRIVTATPDSIVIKKYEDGENTASATLESYVAKKLQKSSFSRMKHRLKPNMWEVLENVVVAAAYHPIIARNKLMGPEFYSFCLADITHEFLFKGFAESMADALTPTTLSGDEATSFFSTGDFSDAMRKTPFVVALQQIYQKALFSKSWGHQIVSNLLGDFSILAVSNVGDRMWSADSDGYTYP